MEDGGTMTPIADITRKSDKDPGIAHNGGTPPPQREYRQSRLLTKKQLSDMALGIRELSKKLAHIQLKLRVRNVFLLAKAHDETLIQYTRELAEWLLSKEKESYCVYVESTLKENSIFNSEGLLEKNPKFEERLKWWDHELCSRRPQTFDVVIAVRWTRWEGFMRARLTIVARRRRHGALRKLVVPTRRATSPRVRTGISGISDQIRLRPVRRDLDSSIQRRYHRQPTPPVRSYRYAKPAARDPEQRPGYS
jgi:hypothetical protein